MNSENENLIHHLTKIIQQENEKQTSTLKREFKTDISEVKLEIAEIKAEIKTTLNKTKELQNRLSKLESKYSEVDKFRRKNNIIIFGLENEKQNLAQNTIQKLSELLELNLNNHHVNNIYAIGKSENHKPVVVEFTSYLTKLEVLRNSKKLKGTDISICEDLNREERQLRKKLLKHQKEARKKNLKAFIKGNKLIIGNEAYTIDQLEPIESESEINEGNEEQLVENKSASAPSTPNVKEKENAEITAEGNADQYTDVLEKLRNFKKQKITKSEENTSRPVTRNLGKEKRSPQKVISGKGTPKLNTPKFSK